MLKFFRDLVDNIKDCLLGIKVMILGLVDSLKYIREDDVYPHIEYLCKYDREAYKERLHQIYSKYFDQRLYLEMRKRIDREFERARKRR